VAFNGFGEATLIVAALEHGNKPTTRGGIGHFQKHPGERCVVLVGESKLAQRIADTAVETGRKKDQVGLEVSHLLRESAAEGRSDLLHPRSSRQG